MIIFTVTQAEAGGAQSAALRNSQALRQAGIPSQVWFLYRKTDAYDNTDGVNFILPYAPRGFGDVLKILWGLFKKIRESRPDAIISFTHYANIITHLISFFLGVNARIASHRNPLSSYPRLAKIIDFFMGTTGIYTKITCVSNAVMKDFENYPKSYRNRLSVITNGVPVFDKINSEVLERSSNTVLMIGRLVEQKNHEVVIKSIAKIPDIKLIIAGKGPLREELESLVVKLGVKDRVDFLGEVSREKVSELLMSTMIYAMPSIFEGMSNAMLEAMAHECCIIASDIPPQRELIYTVPDQPCGILVDPHDDQAWSQNLSLLFADQKLRLRFSTLAGEASKEYSFEASAKKYLKLIGKFSGRNPLC